MARYLLVALALAFAGCTDYLEDDDGKDPYDYEVGDEKADGLGAVFNANDVIDDATFTDGFAMDVEAVQTFLERTPYHNRSWLAGATINGVTAAQAIVDAAQTSNIHPLVLVARMQVESSLVAKTVKPAQRLVDAATGCGCPDGGGCSVSYKGLDKQLDCAAKTMRKWFDGSVDKTGEWQMGKRGKTLDPKFVTPANHATASLYAYTPWVLQGSGGTWLAWNVTRKYINYAKDNGLIATP